ncbi:lytic transglycosylase domain-containing protein [Paenibacillus sp. PCH8]|uniref:lytic transglycosylase domain-containing protein n=1 Tax=Paenibacillus sp. PCH8 TaxID=2066524 RepID=UPI0015E395ED|nr:transglycosylase SLT domain-containing protein [Paenibacillus sp. PCH8]
MGIFAALMSFVSLFGNLSVAGNDKSVEVVVDSVRLEQVKKDSRETVHEEMVEMLEGYIESHHEKKVNRAKLLKYVKWVEQYTKESDVDSLWILAMMWQESRMLEKSVSSHGAIGLLQILPSTAQSFGVSENALYEAKTNIKTSIIYMNYLMDKYEGNLRTATIAYNQGEGNVAKGKARSWYYNQVKEHYNKMLKMLK